MESSGQEIPVPAANFVAVLHDTPPLPKNDPGAQLNNQRGWQPAPRALARRERHSVMADFLQRAPQGAMGKRKQKLPSADSLTRSRATRFALQCGAMSHGLAGNATIAELEMPVGGAGKAVVVTHFPWRLFPREIVLTRFFPVFPLSSWHICDCCIPGTPARGWSDRRLHPERGGECARWSAAGSQKLPGTGNTRSTRLLAAEPSPS